MKRPLVGVIMGSDSDLPTMKAAGGDARLRTKLRAHKPRMARESRRKNDR